MTDISTSLLAQVRQLQGVLAERDETLKALNLEKSRLETEAQGFSQRLKSLDESEQRYKDENWNLETQTHELLASAKESSSREQRLQQTLAITNSEKSTAQRELDEMKQAHGKLSEDLLAFRKFHDSEIGALRKSGLSAESERNALQRKLEELTSQNQELAKAVAANLRPNTQTPTGEVVSEPEDFSLNRSDQEHSPPPSPSKGMPRNPMLESETLKSSLQHAHRMIQNLKNGIHREKSEKLELKRMLQESRDELEARRTEGSNGTANKRSRKSQAEPGKKSSRVNQLGAGRSGRTEIELDEAEWEDHHGEGLPKGAAISRSIGGPTRITDASDAYQTANETDAFETANERETSTETEAFQTGQEDVGADSSDDLTETESGVARANTVRPSKVSPLTHRQSYLSTASTSDDEPNHEPKTPVQQPLKYRLKVGRGSRRSRVGSEGPESTPPSFKDSPASFVSNRGENGQSLFAELGEFGGEDYADETGGTPVKSLNASRQVTPRRGTSVTQNQALPSERSVSNTGVMTEPITPPQPTPVSAVPASIPPASHGEIAGRRDSAAISSDEGFQLIPQGPPKPSDTAANGAAFQERRVLVPLAFSEIQSLETVPSKPASQKSEHQPPLATLQANGPDRSNKSNEVSETPQKSGVIGSVLGWAIGKKQGTPERDEAESSDRKPDDSVAEFKKAPFTEVSPNVPSRAPLNQQHHKEENIIKNADQSSQTLLSSDSVEKLLAAKEDKPATNATPLAITTSKAVSPKFSRDPSQPSPALTPRSVVNREGVPAIRPVKRPTSSGGPRTSNVNMPPLPVDHRQAIAAASQQAPAKERNEGAMGPPLFPASAYRSMGKRPQTPQEQDLQSPASTTPRARYSQARSTRSRRSSVSSFESELDARFNIRADGMPISHGMDPNTDPRMIQAITQTMIGEYLWKYTRKAGRGEMSDKRHRRFFWVHPYTRTLYWSEQDPSTAGRAQLKAKSVAIEAVRVVVDDNPMPPGLHRKSLIIITPGRDVKFTATTGQRHETWFNALSYLLLRSGSIPQQQQSADHVTAEDVAEFNPRFGRAAGPRFSLSSYNSRTNTTRHSRASSRDPSPTKGVPGAGAGVAGSVRRVPATQHVSTSSRYSNLPNNHSSIGSRLSSYWRPNRASVAGGQTREGGASESIYNASVVNDSAEDVRQVLENQDKESDRLENVRACCDGLSSWPFPSLGEGRFD